MPTIRIAGRTIDYVRIGGARPARPPLVFLHEGLGSIAMWRDFPARVAAATGCDAVVYSRHGYGNSSPLDAPRAVEYMHDEALDVLPRLLDELGVARPVLVGHSDGASIALLHAGASGRPVAGVVAMAPHVMVEDVSIAAIEAARVAYASTDLRDRLARHHADVDSAFLGWNRVWLDPAFRAWNIESCLAGIRCPLLAIQGEDDAYGTMEQLRRIAAHVPAAELVALAACRHSPHRDRPDAVEAAIAAFVDRIAPP